MMLDIRLGVAALAALPLLVTGCATAYGSRTVRPTSTDYTSAIAQAWNEQMLGNLVRLRYRDTPQFLQVSSVLTQFEYRGGAGAVAAVGLGGSDAAIALGGVDGDIGAGRANFEYSERPTITWLPLQGREFAERLLSPIAPATILLLAQSGWSVERLLLCCVAQVNALRNAASAAGPTPDYEPEFAAFQRVAELMRKLQTAGAIDVSLREVDGKEQMILSVHPPNPETEAYFDEMRRRLGVREDATEFTLTTMRAERSPQEIMIIGRTLIGVLFFLSQAVEAPPEHVEAGLVTVTRRADGTPFEWSELTGRLFRVQSSMTDPGARAFVKVRLRGHWFFLEDRDLNSKTTFSLVRYLFSLQATAGGAAPLLTVTTGR